MGVIADAFVAALNENPVVKEDVAALGEIIENFILAQTFLNLTDTPDSYVGKAGYLVVCNATEDGVEFVAPA